MARAGTAESGTPNLLLFFDCESTSMVARVDEITQIASLMYDPATGSVIEFSRYVRPLYRQIQPAAAAITGITNEFVASRDTFAKVFGMWKAWIQRVSRGRTIEWVAHNGYRFDFVLLASSLIRHGVVSGAESLQHLLCHELRIRALHDTLVLSRRQNVSMKRHTLTHVWRWAVNKSEEDQFEDAHNALGDCRAMLSIHLTGRLPLCEEAAFTIPTCIASVLEAKSTRRRKVSKAKTSPSKNEKKTAARKGRRTDGTHATNQKSRKDKANKGEKEAREEKTLTHEVEMETEDERKGEEKEENEEEKKEEMNEEVDEEKEETITTVDYTEGREEDKQLEWHTRALFNAKMFLEGFRFNDTSSSKLDAFEE